MVQTIIVPSLPKNGLNTKEFELPKHRCGTYFLVPSKDSFGSGNYCDNERVYIRSHNNGTVIKTIWSGEYAVVYSMEGLSASTYYKSLAVYSL